MTPKQKQKHDLNRLIKSFTNSGRPDIVEKLKDELKALDGDQSVPDADRNNDDKTGRDSDEALHKNNSRVVQNGAAEVVED